MKKKTLILLFIIISFCGFGQAQEERQTTHFQVVDASNGKPVSLVHIINLGIQKGIIADMSGSFSAPIGKGDTLIISALGFHEMRIPFGKQLPSSIELFTIRLTPRSYLIREVRITRFGSYQRFIREVTAMEVPKTDQEKLQERLEKYLQEQITRMDIKNLPSAQAGIVWGTDWATKQKALIKEKDEELLRWDIISAKFSVSLIQRLTGLSGSDAIAFMEFCAFTEGFLLRASDYEIHQLILERFDVYKEIHNLLDRE